MSLEFIKEDDYLLKKPPFIFSSQINTQKGNEAFWSYLSLLSLLLKK